MCHSIPESKLVHCAAGKEEKVPLLDEGAMTGDAPRNSFDRRALRRDNRNNGLLAKVLDTCDSDYCIYLAPPGRDNRRGIHRGGE